LTTIGIASIGRAEVGELVINCSNCSAGNPADSRFCGNCGASLAQECSECGHENPAANNFCASCGSLLRPDASAEDTTRSRPPAGETITADLGERRFVSVLFADLVGFTAYSESRDPEEVRAMLTRYFDRAQEVIERFGGEVEKFIGDAVTAFWGTRQAQEDDAERAVRSALELVDAVNALGDELGVPELAVRVGVLSGETAVGTGGNETGMIIGDIVNTASRLQSAAGPGSVFVGEATKLLTDAAIRYESVGNIEVKGKSDAVTAWRATSVIGERGGRGRWEMLEPPFVGRGDELRLLKDQLHATTREGAARLVSIVGEAGIGKSRLVWELLKYIDGVTEAFRWHQGRSPAYGDGVTFWALAEMVRSRAGIAERDEPLKARTKLRTAVVEFVPDPEEQQWIEPRLAGLLGLDEMPAGDRNELYSALRSFFQHVAATGTTVLFFEDIHWADEGQLEFIEELIEMSPRHPIFVITLARPELLDRHPTWGSARHHFLSMHLGPLGAADMADLVTGLAPGIADPVVELIVERAGGVPLYAVEYVRMMINGGDLVLEGITYRQTRELVEVALPDSLQAMVGARLDRLDQKSRSLVQDAAILGQSFSLEGMTALTGQAAADLESSLRDLARQELIRYDTDPRSPERGQFQFVQSVIREVAYSRIAKADRKDRHIKVAEFYEVEAPIEAAAVIASHYMNAYDNGHNDEMAGKARAALMNAAQRAAELKSHAQALGLVEQALAVPGPADQQAAMWEFAAPVAAALFRHEEGIEYARKALDWHTEHGSPADVSLAVLISAEATGHASLAIEAMNTRGTALGSLGRAYESIALLRESLRLAEQHALPYATLRALNNLAVGEAVNGIAALKDSWKRGYELALRVRDGGLLARMSTARASGLFEEGEFAGALSVLEDLDLGDESVWADFVAAFAEWIRWHQTGDSEHIRIARRWNNPLLEHPEPQYRSGAIDNEVTYRWIEGDLEGVLELARQVDPPQPHHEFRHHAIAAAMRLGDAEKLRAAIELIELPNGRRYDVLRFAGETGLELLEGDSDKAAAMFAELIEQFREVESPRYVATWKAVFALVMPERPEAGRAASEAGYWFSEVGAQGLLNLYAEVWDRQSGEDFAAG
jgi:class 3 adenylate cyclase/tetratricopeptide (TPR) repeat protein